MTITRQQKIEKANQAIANNTFDIILAVSNEAPAYKYSSNLSLAEILKEALKSNHHYCIVKIKADEILVFALDTTPPARINKYFLSVDSQGKFVLKDSLSNWIGWHRSESSSQDIHVAIPKCLGKLQGAGNFQLVNHERLLKSIKSLLKQSHGERLEKNKNNYRKQIQTHLDKIKKSAFQIVNNLRSDDPHLNQEEVRVGLEVYQSLRKKYAVKFRAAAGNSVEAKVDDILFSLECYLAYMIDPAASHPQLTLQDISKRRGHQNSNAVYKKALRTLLDPQAKDAGFPNVFHKGSKASYHIDGKAYNFREILAYYWLAASDPNQDFPPETEQSSRQQYLDASILNFVSVIAEIRTAHGLAKDGIGDRPSCQPGAFGRLTKNGLLYRTLGKQEQTFAEIDTLSSQIHSFILRRTEPQLITAMAELFYRKAVALEENDEIFDETGEGKFLKDMNACFIAKLKLNHISILINFIYQNLPLLKESHEKYILRTPALYEDFKTSILKIYEIELMWLDVDSLYFEPNSDFLDRISKQTVTFFVEPLQNETFKTLSVILKDLNKLEPTPSVMLKDDIDDLYRKIESCKDKRDSCLEDYYKKLDVLLNEAKLKLGVVDADLSNNEASQIITSYNISISDRSYRIYKDAQKKIPTPVRIASFNVAFDKDIQAFCSRFDLDANILKDITIGAENGANAKHVRRKADGTYVEKPRNFNDVYTTLSSPTFAEPQTTKQVIFNLPRIFSWIYNMVERSDSNYFAIFVSYRCFYFEYLKDYQYLLPPKNLHPSYKPIIKQLMDSTGYNLCGPEEVILDDMSALKRFIKFLFQKLFSQDFCLDYHFKCNETFSNAADMLHVFLRLDCSREEDKRLLMPHLDIEQAIINLSRFNCYDVAVKIFDGQPLASLSQASKDRIFAEVSNHPDSKKFCEWLIKHNYKSSPPVVKRESTAFIITALPSITTQNPLYAVKEEEIAIAEQPFVPVDSSLNDDNIEAEELKFRTQFVM